ncbi:MAG TPA: hypothetical protein VFB14_17170 [Bryobacteraceae bacterium]|nr:hypothetical protein [Bryobacteraceae bacterium]
MLISNGSRGSQVEAVIRSACRRRLLVLTLEHSALAVSLVLGGSILMLLLGTQILAWYWLALLGGAGLIIVGLRIRARMLNRYRVAQLVDHRLGLSDSLSTAWFLLTQSGDSETAAARFQIAHAENLAASVNPGRAFPFMGLRLWALAGSLTAIAFGLFAVRYLVTDSLSLQPALIPLNLAAVFERVEDSLSAEKQPLTQADALDERIKNVRDTAESGQDGTLGEKSESAAASPQIGKPDDNSAENPQHANKAEGQSRVTQNGGSQADASKQSSDRQAEQRAETENQNESRAGSTPASSQQDAGAKGEQDANQQRSPGLMDKMKDAVSSLMAKMRPNSSAQKSTQNGDQAVRNQKPGDQNSTNREQNEASQNAQTDQDSEQQSAEAQAQEQVSQKAQASRGRSPNESAEKKNSDSHSGIGSQNGDKSVQEAEQLQAMGKLAEIIGKRSANLTGDITVETPSGKEQLKTAYSQKVGQHADLGGEINRDEVPLEYQQYVREYMERIHNQPKGR